MTELKVLQVQSSEGLSAWFPHKLLLVKSAGARHLKFSESGKIRFGFCFSTNCEKKQLFEEGLCIEQLTSILPIDFSAEFYLD